MRDAIISALTKIDSRARTFPLEQQHKHIEPALEQTRQTSPSTFSRKDDMNAFVRQGKCCMSLHAKQGRITLVGSHQETRRQKEVGVVFLESNQLSALNID